MAITKNMVTDYGADNTGATDAAPKFYVNLKTDMAGQDVVTLTIPADSYKFGSSGGQTWAGGMRVLNATVTGATLFESSGGGVELGSLHFPTKGIDEATGGSARIQSVSSGATSVTLTAASAASGYISRAVNGRWMMIAGYNIQDLFQQPYGFPPNFHFLDFVQITGIVGNTISFTPALQNSYLSTWPEINRGNAFQADAAGPATAFFLHADWDHDSTFTGGTYTAANLIKGEGKSFTMVGGDSSSGQPIFPTVNKTWTATNHTSTGALVEHDKLNDLVQVSGGTYSQWHCQSSSTRMLTLTGVTFNSSVNGTSRNAVIDTCTIGGGLNIGPTSYGRADTFICRNTSIAGAIGGGLSEAGENNVGFHNYATMTAGVIKIPSSESEFCHRWSVPDPSGRNVCFWSGTSGTFGSFKVLSVTQDSWPPADTQSSTTTVTISASSKNLAVSSSIFASGDVGKVIFIPGAGGGGGIHSTFITGFTDAQHVTIFEAANTAVSGVSQTIQWFTSNTYVQTDQAGGLPSSSLHGGDLRVIVPPARTVYFENCTGTAHAVDLSQTGAQNKPLWSYTKRTYDGSTGATGAANIILHGNITSVKVNVITPYTGASSLNMGFSQFDNLPVVASGAYTTYGPRFNLKQTGERVIQVGSTTGAWGGASPDTNLNLSVATWIGRAFQASMSRDISAESSSLWPSFTIEIITDQGFFTGPTAVAPLRLRLRA